MSKANMRPKPSGWKWYLGERGGWWYKETVYGVRTGCPSCGARSRLGYQSEIRHRTDCKRHRLAPALRGLGRFLRVCGGVRR